MYQVGYNIDGVEHYWSSCGWSEHRSGGTKYSKGDASHIISQMNLDDIFAYLV